MEFAKEQRINKVFETSAKTGYNVEEVFSCVAKELYLQVRKELETQIKTAEVDSKDDQPKE